MTAPSGIRSCWNHHVTHRRDFGLCLGPGHSVRQAGHDGIIVATPFSCRRGLQRRPDVCHNVRLEAFRHHADDGMGFAPQCNSDVQDGRIAVEDPAECAVTEYGHGQPALTIFLLGETPSQCRFDSKNAEEACRNTLLLQELDSIVHREVDAACRLSKDGRVQVGRLVAHSLPDASRLGHLISFPPDALEVHRDLGQPVGFRVGQGAEKDRVHYAEQRGVGADTQGQSCDDRRCKNRASPEQAHRVDQVAAQHSKNSQSDGLAALVFYSADCPEFDTCPPARFVGGQTFGDQVLGVELDVRSQFRVHFLFQARATKNRA